MSERNDLKRAIDTIIATDKKAREATQRVRENAANADKHIAERVNAVRDEYMSRALRRVDVIKNAEAEYADGQWEKTQKKYQNASDALDARYSEMGDRWVDELFKNVIDAD